MNADLRVPAPELGRRIGAFQDRLRADGIDGALILQKADLFYLSGTAQDGILYVPADGAPLLMIRKSLERAQGESLLPEVRPLTGTGDLLREMEARSFPFPKVLGLEMDVLPAALYLGFQRRFPGARLVGVSSRLRAVRAVKSPYELGRLREAGRRADQVLAQVAEHIRPGVTELALAGRVEALARELGHPGLVRMRRWGSEIFYGHLMAGETAARPSFLASPTGGAGTGPATPQSAGLRPIGPGEPILVDYVFVWEGYIADQTRVFVLGEPPDDLLRAHDAMREVQSALQGAARPGAVAGDLYEMAVAEAERLGFGEYFMGSGDDRISFVGHGVGLELDEFPFIARGQTQALEAGMVIALEPKQILPGRGVVGIENTHVVGPEGLTPLTAFREEMIRIG
ncbi:MAG: M24 family metallopeptidase [Desulfococcaceae bacterium]